MSLIVDNSWVSLWFKSDLLDVSLQTIVELMEAQVTRQCGWSSGWGAVTRTRAAATGVPSCLMGGGGCMLFIVVLKTGLLGTNFMLENLTEPPWLNPVPELS